MQPDDEVTKRYRGIAREEPSASMDAAILAASRRALAPSLSRRWGVPVSIAAVLVLTFGLTLEMRHEEPGIESSLPATSPEAAPPAQPAAPPAKDSLSGVPQAVTRPQELRKQRTREEIKPAIREQKIEQPAQEEPSAKRYGPAAFPAAPPAPAAQSALPAAAAPAPQRMQSQDMNASPAPALAPRAKAAAGAALRMAPAQAESDSDAAVRELERIAALRAAGRDAEADKALDDFLRDHPGYRIPEAMWERVKPR